MCQQSLLLSVVQMAIVKVFNGIGLEMVVPAIQSLVADSHKENARGLGFGWLHASGQFRTLTGGVFCNTAGRLQGRISTWLAVCILCCHDPQLAARCCHLHLQKMSNPLQSQPTHLQGQ